MINLYTPERSFQAFKQTIVDCTDTSSPTNAFLMNRETISGNTLEEFYIPFDYVNENAKIFVIGITPGVTQWANAVEEAQKAINEGCSDEETLRRAKTTGAFSGDLRSNLVKMMDYIGLNALFNLGTCAELFETKADLVHWTSSFVNPILCNGNNYNGSAPTVNLKKQAILQNSFTNGILKEIEAVPNALYLPLGKVPNELFGQLVANHQIDPQKVLLGMPHPSRASAERVACFLDEKTSGFSRLTNPVKIHAARAALIEQVKHFM
nr:MAG TPA: G/U mismatch-specific DNA glycosylase [Caudoviricetes sp.]